ncbi:hypothetical protein [Ureaplasma diversum]|uniref:Uncharacterized protein n=1 Tax=Ureaplasma diversum NCTC 246 TaxID=1188241 RepID=A0A084F076_9BACT|nr:hypothetical protein [Ureaplasma diversum]KEZ23618.1 hypothetical protein UDIV_2710 [Ureaplasma diversum NCTC 246]
MCTTIAKKTTPTQNQKVETNKEVSTTKTTQDQPLIKDNQVNKEQIQDTKQTESKELKEYKEAKEFVISNYSSYVLADEKTVDPEVKEYGLTFLSERLAILEKVKAKIDKKESLADMADELSKIKTLKEDWEKIQKENTDALKSVNPDYKEDGEVPEKENWWSTDPDSKTDKAKGDQTHGGKAQGDEPLPADQPAPPADQATPPVSSPAPANVSDEQIENVIKLFKQQNFSLNGSVFLLKSFSNIKDKQELLKLIDLYKKYFDSEVSKYLNKEKLVNPNNVAYLATLYSQFKQFVNLLTQIERLHKNGKTAYLEAVEAGANEIVASLDESKFTPEKDPKGHNKQDAYDEINQKLTILFYESLKKETK